MQNTYLANYNNFKQHIFFNNCNIVKTDNVDYSIFKKIENFNKDLIKKNASATYWNFYFCGKFSNFSNQNNSESCNF